VVRAVGIEPTFPLRKQINKQMLTTVYKKHMEAKTSGQVCIDCHKGIAHHLPKEYRDPGED